MSDTQTNWILNLIDRWSKPIASAEKATREQEKAVDGVTAAVNDMGKASADAFDWYINGATQATKAVERQQKEIKKLTAIDIHAIGDSFDRISTMIDNAAAPGKTFQSQLLETSAITGATGNQLDMLGDSARQTALDFGGNAAAQLESYKTILSRFGPDIAQVPSAVDAMGRSVQTLSKTMAGDAVGATDALTTAMLQYQVDLQDPIAASKEMERMMNVMAAGAKYGAAEVPQISEAIKDAGVSAKLANLSFEETNAAIQAMAAGGKYGGEAGIGLRNFLTTINSPDMLSKDAVGILDAYNISMSKIADTSIPFADRLRMLQPLQNDLNALSVVFGRENSANAQILIRSAQEQANLTTQITGTNTAVEQAQVVMSSHEEQMKRWGAWIDDVKISFFNVTQSFLPFIGGAADAISIMANLKNAQEGIKIITEAVTGATWLQNIATSALTAGQWLLNAAFVASPIGWVVLALGALAGGVMIAWNKFEGFRAVVMGLWETFKQVFNNISGLFKAVFSPIGEAIEAVQNGDWRGAAKAALKLNPVSTAARTFDYISDGGLTKGISDAYNRGAEMGRASFQKDNAKPAASTPSVTGSAKEAFTTTPAMPNPVTGATKGGGTTGKGAGNGLSISGGKGGHTITQTITIHNHFTGATDPRKVANDVVAIINDHLRDGLVSLG